jgi:hypothetical protein
MTFTHEQFAMAVQQVGSHGRPFSSAAVRACLGMTADDKRALTRFNHELCAYHKATGGRVERLAKNRYRLCSVEPAASAAPQPTFDALHEPEELEALAPCVPSAERPTRTTVHSSTIREDGQIKIRIVVRRGLVDDDDLWSDGPLEVLEPAPLPARSSALDTFLRPMLRVFSR